MKWNIVTDPLIALHAKPQLVTNPSIYPGSSTLTAKIL